MIKGVFDNSVKGRDPMKRSFVFSFVLLGLGFLFGLGFVEFRGHGSTVEAQGPFRGSEVCFEVGGPGGLIVKVAALSLGNNHYLLSGRLTDPSDSSYIEPVFGNLEIKAGKLHLSFISSRSATGTVDDTVSTGFISNGVVDAQTLIGTVQSFGIEHDTADGMTRVDHGAPVSFQRIACP